METRKLIIAAVVIALIIVFSVIPFNNKRAVIINASLNNVTKEIDDLNNWKDWNSDLKDKNIQVQGTLNEDQFASIETAYSYLLHHISATIVELTRKENEDSTLSVIKILPVTQSTTKIIWSEKVAVFVIIKRNMATHYSRQNSLDELKKIVENAN